MQDGNSGEKKKNNLLGDEECINFRPSPNFKHMRKYLKSKFEEANSSPNQSSDRSNSPNSEEQETVKTQQAPPSSMAQRVQPPLPPNSPPPEFLVVPKQEVEDKEYNEKPALQPVKTEEVVKKTPEETMCRQFARGTCTRGLNCIYAHKIILEQLPGVYTFCKNFQNSVCTLPKCKFVHATVFEKEHYYRTGILPPHALAHLKESNSPLGPHKPLEGAPNEAQQVFANQPAPMHPGVPVIPPNGCPPPDGRAKPEMFGSNHLAALRQSSAIKREWSETDMASAAHDLDSNGPMPRKCKTCHITELRLQHSKTKKEQLLEEAEMLEKRRQQLMKKDARLNNILDVVLQFNMPLSSSSILTGKFSLRNNSDSPKVCRLPPSRRPSENNGLSHRLSLELTNRLRGMTRTQRRMLCHILNIEDIFAERLDSPPNSRAH